MAKISGNLKPILQQLCTAALMLTGLLFLLPDTLDAQQQAQAQDRLPRFATWRVGEYGNDRKLGNGIYRLSYSPDGKYLASRSKNNVVVVYELKSKTAICEVEGHEDWIETIDFSPDGEFFVTASGGSDKVKIWKTRTGRLQFEIDTVGAAAFFNGAGKQINVLGETHVESYSWPGVQLTKQRKWKNGNETARTMSRDGGFVIAFRGLNRQFYQTLMIDTDS